MTNLGRVNQASDVVDGIRALLAEPGDFAVKYRAGKIPQAGVVTLTFSGDMALRLEVECLEVDGVGWIPQELSDGIRFTSFGTEPALEVLVPSSYAPEGLLLPAFSDAARALPSNGLACR